LSGDLQRSTFADQLPPLA